MIDRRVLVTVVALASVAACKKHGAEPTRTTTGSDVASGSGAGSGSAGSAVASGSDIGSALPQPGGVITHPFFYKVEKAGKTSYLIGTWHLGIDAEKQMPPAVWTALDGAKTFVMEADPADPIGLSAGTRTDGKTLDEELGPEEWAKLGSMVEAQTLGAMKTMKPFAATLLLQFVGLPQTPPMDLAFAGKARDGKKQIVFLEPMKLQIKVLEKWIDLRMLEATIDDLDGTRKKIEDALAAYLAGDDAALITMTLDKEGMKEAGFTDAELEQAIKEMLYDRNASWIPTLEELFAKGDAFVAVGAGHLVGPRSVVELLQAKGYTITRIGAERT